jgi:hypothetical protein
VISRGRRYVSRYDLIESLPTKQALPERQRHEEVTTGDFEVFAVEGEDDIPDLRTARDDEFAWDGKISSNLGSFNHYDFLAYL